VTIGLIWGVILMSVPSVSALIAAAVDFTATGEAFTWKGYFHKVGFRKCKLRYVFMGFLIPFIYALVFHGLFWITNPGSLRLDDTNPGGHVLSLLALAVYGTLINLTACSCEEIGWRGFMVPALYERLGIKKTLLLSGIIWSVWHAPIVCAGLYFDGTPVWFGCVTLFLCCLGISIIIGIWSVKTKSVRPAAVFHAAHNCIIQSVVGPISVAENKAFLLAKTEFSH